MATRPVSVRILNPEPGPGAGPIERWVAEARASLARRHTSEFVVAGATDVAVVGGPPDDTPFGVRLRAIVRAIVRSRPPGGLVILGSGAMPLAAPRDYRDFVQAAGAARHIALANNRYSADVVAIPDAVILADVPDLPADNPLPRWLAEVAGYEVTDLRARWRLAFDIDGPLELLMLGNTAAAGTDVHGLDLSGVRARLAAVRAVSADPRSELTVAGRTSVRSLAWMERAIPARVRAIVEERGLRAASRLAQTRPSAEGTPRPDPRPPESILGMLLERDGPEALGRLLAQLGEAAIIDSRVLIAHRLGGDESAWPQPEDRFASDILLPDRIRDPWLKRLTEAAIAAPIPVLLGGHSLVGPGVRLLLGPAGRRRRRPWS